MMKKFIAIITAILTGALGMTVFAPTAANALSCAN